MKSLPLYEGRDHECDWLVALEFGRVLDGQPGDHFLPVDDHAAFVLDGPGGDVVGVWVNDLRDYDPATPGSEALWRGPRFDVPLLGLRDAYAGELVLAAQASLLTESTINRCYLDMAVSEEPGAIGASDGRYLPAGQLCFDDLKLRLVGATATQSALVRRTSSLAA